MNLHIYLGNNLTTWVDTFTNGRPISKVICKPTVSLRKNLKAGNLSSNSLKLDISGLTSYCNEFIGYKYMKFVRDGNITFIGVLQTFNRKAETTTTSTYSITYKDFAEDWKDSVFCADPKSAKTAGDNRAVDIGNVKDKPTMLAYLEEQRDKFYTMYTTGAWGSDNSYVYEAYTKYVNIIDDVNSNRGSGEYVWSWEVITSDGYKVCDPSNPSKSLLHSVIAFLPNANKLSINCTVTRSTTVTAFKVNGEDKILDILSDICEQNSLAITLEGFALTVHDLYAQSGTAGTVSRIEKDAVLTDKPYVDKTFPDVRWCSQVDEVAYNHSLLCKGLFYASAPDALKSAESYDKPRLYPSEGGGMELAFQPTIPANSEVLTTRVTKWGTWVSKRSFLSDPFGNAFPEFVEYKHHDTTAYATLKNTHEYVTFKEWGVYADGSATFVAYNRVVKSNWTNGKEETFKYIYSADDARRFDDVRHWQKKADSRYYTFYADNNLALGQLVTLQNISSDALIIISKTDKLDEFGGYTYTATEVINPQEVSFDERYTALDYTLPDVGQFDISAPRTTIDCYPNGTPSDSSSIRVTITCPSAMSTPTLTVDGITANLTQDTVSVTEGGVTYATSSNTWHYDLSPNLDSKQTMLLVATNGNATKSLRFTKQVGNYFDVGYAKGTDPDNPPSNELTWGSDGLYWGTDGIVWNDGTYTATIPTVGEGEYIWMRFRTAQSQSWQYTRLTGVQGEDGKVLLLTSEQTALRMNKYNPNGQGSITFHVTCRGYNEEPQLAYDTGADSGIIDIGDDGVAEYLYDLYPVDRTTFTLSCGDDETVLVLDVVEETTTYHGVKASVPASATIGDSCVDASANYAIKVYTSTGWKTLSESGFYSEDISKICGYAQKDVLGIIQPNTVTASEYGYFYTLIVGMITADIINSRIGTFSGSFNCPTIESLKNTTGGTSVSKDIQAYRGKSSSAQFNDLNSLYSANGLQPNIMYRCSTPTYSTIAFIKKVVQGGNTWFYFYTSTGSEFGYVMREGESYGTPHYSVNVTSAMTLTVTYGQDDILKLKGVQNGSSGLQTNQVYYTTINGHKVLCLV